MKKKKFWEKWVSRMAHCYVEVALALQWYGHVDGHTQENQRAALLFPL